ncbi:MAG: hypothetical protein Q9162_004330 [Coniocarpon cinnabarinum]
MPHTSGLSSDRSLDGVAIGTLIAVIDRAKNLPNLRSMGKQDPYCALRLGKEAKKTETDRRGGQTPRWDQELRFTVYESLDYRKIKVSIFDEDKRTDLIGECFIELDGILQRGGGQNDDWHELNVKGRYAGQIRIELTFYDTRPREASSADATSHTNGLPDPQSEHSSLRTPGPRQPPQVKRRPLPDDSSPSPLSTPHQRANSVPMPSSAPRSYHTPPQAAEPHHPVAEMYDPPYGYENQNNRSFEPPQRPSLADHSYSVPTYPHDQLPEQETEYYELDSESYGQADMPFTDDPQALEAISAVGDIGEQYVPPPVAPLQFARHGQPPHQPTSRPAPPAGPPHSHSAPVLPPSQRRDVNNSASPNLEPRPAHRYGSMQQQHPPHMQNDGFSEPPPPPAHRNSIPHALHTPPRPSPMQVSPGPRRALHHATFSPEHDEEFESGADVFEDQAAHDQPTFSQVQQQYRRRSAEPAHADEFAYIDEQQQTSPYPRAQQPAYQPSHTFQQQTPSPVPARVQALDPPVKARPRSMDVNPSTTRQQPLASASTPSVPLYRPRAISPKATSNDGAQPDSSAQSVAPATPLSRAAPKVRQSASPPVRKPVAKSPSFVDESKGKSQQPTEAAPPDPSSDIFSPDSFAQFNPRISQQAAPKGSINPFDDNKAAQPMYKDTTASPTATTRPKSSSAPSSQEQSTDSFGRIIRSDGRRVDPSDHLPNSTWAPEPEPKGADKDKRVNTGNARNRFGPRTAAAGAAASDNAPATSDAPAQEAQPTRAMPTSRSTPPSRTQAMPPHPSPATHQPQASQTQTPSPSQFQTPSSHRASPASSVPNASPLQTLEKTGRNRLQKPRPSAPLAPSAPGTLNAHPPQARAQVEAMHPTANGPPPPVPGKIPLDTPEYASDYGNDEYYADQNAPNEYTLPSIPPSKLGPLPHPRHSHVPNASYNAHQMPAQAPTHQAPHSSALVIAQPQQSAPQPAPQQAPPPHQPRRPAGYQIVPGTLSEEISKIDIGPSPMRAAGLGGPTGMGTAGGIPTGSVSGGSIMSDDGRRYGGLGGRLRRSRFGA